MSTSPRARRFDVADVRRVLARLVTDDPGRPDLHRRPRHGTRYVVHGEPASLTAEALTELGCPAGVLACLYREACTAAGDLPVGLGVSRQRWLRRVTRAALALLDSVQRHQDTGACWQVAYSAAVAAHPHPIDRRHHPGGRPWMPDSGYSP
ncbi:hypothetical protein [Nocardia wallacei]|uniref:hypothetical protein n=1 Tax=Nocardia wallacei TaxID=480035 RepID=UPI00245585B4|nr:hypothetical protein [Nocardia wallacei]